MTFPALAGAFHGVLGLLPYKTIPPLAIGPLKFYPFGFLVGLAIIIGTVMAGRRARKWGLDERVVAELALWAVIPGIIGAHLYSAIFYFPDRIVVEPLYILKFWDGISSFGGFIGGTTGVIFYLKRNKVPFWPYAECIMYGLVFAWIFGRMGCTVAFDHPGKALMPHFFLAMPYPNRGLGAPSPGPRLNLGFMELLWTLVMAAIFWCKGRRPTFSGWFISVGLILYTPVRFILDFFRAEDRRYAGLTAAQYAAIVLFILAIWLFIRRRKANQLLIPDGEVHIFPDGTAAIPAQHLPALPGAKGEHVKVTGVKKKKKAAVRR